MTKKEEKLKQLLCEIEDLETKHSAFKACLDGQFELLAGTKFGNITVPMDMKRDIMKIIVDKHQGKIDAKRKELKELLESK